VLKSNAPVNSLSPSDFAGTARAYLQSALIDPDNPDNPRSHTVPWQSEKLFYRTHEIRTRAWLVNAVIEPDVVVCLHFNAEAWGNPARPQFVPRNHLHLLVNGTYSAAEMRLHDQRFDMVSRLLSRVHGEERALSEAVAASMAAATGLPAYEYTTPNAKRVGPSPYVYARNLLANRVYRCPVVFIEPYVMNNREVHDRVKAGDYEGLKMVAGQQRQSIFREYADGVAEGLKNYYSTNRRR